MSAPTADLIAARRWLWLSVAVLLVAGAFALLLVLGRMPPFDSLVTDPGFFRRGLVVHVQLSLVCWFLAFVAALLTSLPRSGLAPWLVPVAPGIALAGVLLLCGSAFAPGGRPVMSNYVPMVDHPLAAAGLALFGLGVLCAVLSRRLVPSATTADRRDSASGTGPPGLTAPAVQSGLRTAGLALLIAVVTLLATLPGLPVGVAADVHYETLFWGTGHVLQVASTAAMLAIWICCVHGATGRAPMSQRTAALAFAVLLLPWLVAPLLPAAGTWSATYRVGFTRLMQFGIAPAVLWVLGACIAGLWSARRRSALRAWDLRVLGFATSAGLTVLGFVLGALIRDANTMVPAHYHANIGAVTAAFMAASFALLHEWGLEPLTGRLARLCRWQPLLFGAGQAVFALGFGLAGSQGMARKVYGAEQAARGGIETAGLVVMGVGGFVAIAAGVLFLSAHIRIFTRALAEAPAAGQLVPGGPRVRV